MNEADRKLWLAWRRRNDEHAFAALVRPHLAFATDLARRVGCSPHDADDVVQVALAQLARERGDRPIKVGLKAWLGRSVVLQARMQRRSRARRSRHEQSVRLAPGPGSGDRYEHREEVETYLAGLPEPQREAVVLRYLHDMEYRDIAHITGATENACRLRVHKGIERLRARFGQHAGALLAGLALLAGKANAAPVRAALKAASAQPGIALAGGAIIMKKSITTVLVLVCVAGSFYLLGRETGGSAASVRDPGHTLDVTDGSRDRTVHVPETVPDGAPGAKPDGGADETPAASAERDELLAAIFAAHGVVCFATEEEYLAGDVQWFKTLESVPDGEITGIRLTGGSVKALVPKLATLTSLRVLQLAETDLDDEALAGLAGLAQLIYLDVSKTWVTDAGLVHLSGMRRLHRLRLDETKVTDAGLAALAHLGMLVELDIRETAVTDAGLAHLASLGSLKRLRFEDTKVTASGLASLADLASLERLDLAGMSVTAESFAHLGRLRHLKRVSLGEATFADDGAYAGLARLTSAEEIELSEAEITDLHLVHLRGLSNLRRLSLDETSIGDAGLEHIGVLVGLEKLELQDSQVTDAGLQHLKDLTSLTELSLGNTDITDAGLEPLAGLTALRILDLEETGLTDAAVDVLSRLTQLERLDLRGTRLSVEGLAGLQAALPDTEIRLK